ncbi:MAG: phosphonate C-P lyase system protein PhnH [Rubrivivax sp.]|nr:phosphonate C-P lyase system protein PhnH [Rubrivivax sp.]
MNATELATLPAGFATPGPTSQAVFRRTLEALSRPGRTQSLALPQLAAFAPPPPLSTAMAALLLTLLDGETSLWLSPAFDTQMLRAWLPFHTGVNFTQRIAQADFVAARADELDPELWSALGRGSDEQPQDGATLLLEVRGLGHGLGHRRIDGLALTLAGPGIETRQRLAVAGVNAEVWQLRRDDEALFPRGVDLLLCCGDALVALPRSTNLTLEG